MTSYVPPKKNTAYTFYCGLADMSALPNLRSNPTLAAGDVVVEIDGVANGNIGTLPVVTPASTRSVKVVMTADEMNGDNIVIKFIDQTTPKEWADLMIVIQTTANQIDDLALAATALSSAVWTPTKAGYLDTAISGIATSVWAVGTRTLTSFGTLAADVWTNGTRTLTSFGTLVQDIWDAATSAMTTVGSIGKLLVTNIDAKISSVISGALTAADVWAYVNRTLTMTAAQIASVVAGTTITIYRGDTLSASLSGITTYTGWNRLWFTVKDNSHESDRRGSIQIVLSSPADPGDGLLVIAGQTATASDGNLTADDPALGVVTINLAADATRHLVPGNYYYDIQALDGTTITTLAAGTLSVTADITRSII